MRHIGRQPSAFCRPAVLRGLPQWQLWILVVFAAMLLCVTTSLVADELLGLSAAIGFLIGLGLCCIVLISAVALIRIRLALLQNEERDFALACSCAAAKSEVVQRDDLTLWQSSAHDWSALVFDEWNQAKEHFAALTGNTVDLSSRLRVFLFADRRGLLQYAARLGFRMPGILDGVFVAATPGRIVTEMPNPLKRLTQPGSFLRSLFGPALLFDFKGFLVDAWLSIGVGGLVGRDVSSGAQARLNRRVLPGVLSLRPIPNAQGMFRLDRRMLFRTLGDMPGDEEYANSFRILYSCHSLIHYIAGDVAPANRIKAFQAFLRDLKARENVDTALRSHFDYGLDQLYNNWREWVIEKSIGDHEPPPGAIRRSLLEYIIPLATDLRAPLEDRVQAVRDMGHGGYILGADTLIDLVRDREREVRSAAAWSLEMISGTDGGEDVRHWELWWDNLPRGAEAVVADENGPPPDSR